MLFSCAILARLNETSDLKESFSNYSNMTSYYVLVFAVLFVILLAFATTKWLARSRYGGGGQNMKLIERMYIASDKVLLIVEVSGRYYLLSQDKTGIKKIDQLENFEPKTAEVQKFSDILDKIKNRGN